MFAIFCSHESGILKGSQKGSEEVSMGLGSHDGTCGPLATSGRLLGGSCTPQVPGGLAAMVIIYSANDTGVGVGSDKNSPPLSRGGTMIKAELGGRGRRHLTCSLWQPSSPALTGGSPIGHKMTCPENPNGHPVAKPTNGHTHPDTVYRGPVAHAGAKRALLRGTHSYAMTG